MIATLLLCTLLQTAPAPFTADVIKIVDGDTVDVRAGGETIRVRLAGIDAPERGQPFSRRSKDRLGELCHGKRVTVTPTAIDRHGRVVAWLHVGDAGEPVDSINAVLLADGLAWHYKRYDATPELSALEEAARAKRAGLWADAEPVAPWEWRRAKRPALPAVR